MCEELANAWIVITGAGSGIGRSICKLLSEYNAKVIIADIDLDSAKETQILLKDPSRHVPFKLDVSSSSSIHDLIAHIEEHIGECPIGIVNSAAICTPKSQARRTCLDANEEAWNAVIDVNLKGTFLIDVAFARLMKKHKIKTGSIINISSLAKNGLAPSLEYSASKSGVVGITKTLAQELGADNIRVNAIAPGAIDTPMTTWLTKKLLDGITTSNPLHRIGQPEEVAGVCLFLLSPKLSSYVTGQVINVSGGDTVHNLLPYYE